VIQLPYNVSGKVQRVADQYISKLLEEFYADKNHSLNLMSD